MSKYVFVLWMVAITISVSAKSFSLSSPNGINKVTIKVGKQVSYKLEVRGQEVINSSFISLSLNNQVPGVNGKFKRADSTSINGVIHPVVKQKSAEIIESYNQLKLVFKGYDIVFRAYDDGVAWRFVIHQKGEIVVKDEQAEFNFNGNYKLWFPEETSMMTHMERKYLHTSFGELETGKFCSMPVLVDVGVAKIAITESDLYDYPGMYLEVAGNNSLKGIYPAYALINKAVDLSVRGGDRNIPVIEKAGFIAKTSGNRNFPWRIIAIAENDGDLISNQMVFKLAPKQTNGDFSWVKPGKVAWDWWNALNIYRVDFKSGVNTKTYKYYIDFASKYGIDYIILDEGWYVLGDLMNVVPDIDMEEIIRYGKEKNVGIVLWVVWKTLDDQWNEAFNQFEKWDIKGIKVDFMQRDDQWMVDYYWRVAKEAAKRHMLVDFHGSYKPSGLRRAYPNVITREGVHGLEHNKWGDEETPGLDVTIPFIRMLAGPLDYTPGAMINATKSNFRAVWNRPMSQGTRCHQLAMYVVYESPLQMLADSPSHYYDEPEAMEFLSKVPTVWDETKVLDARVGEYVLIARRNGKQWYIGAMTNWTARDMEIDLSFLGDGVHTFDIWQDGKNANKYGDDFKKLTKKLTRSDKLKIHLVPGGGWAAVVY
jgi:alpha-glucosidase